MQIATISSQRQITLPKAMLESLNLACKDKVRLLVHNDGIMIEPTEKSLNELSGSLLPHVPKAKRGVPLSKIRQTTQKLAVEELVGE